MRAVIRSSTPSRLARRRRRGATRRRAPAAAARRHGLVDDGAARARGRLCTRRGDRRPSVRRASCRSPPTALVGARRARPARFLRCPFRFGPAGRRRRRRGLSRSNRPSPRRRPTSRSKPPPPPTSCDGPSAQRAGSARACAPRSGSPACCLQPRSHSRPRITSGMSRRHAGQWRSRRSSRWCSVSCTLEAPRRIDDLERREHGVRARSRPRRVPPRTHPEEPIPIAVAMPWVDLTLTDAAGRSSREGARARRFRADDVGAARRSRSPCRRCSTPARRASSATPSRSSTPEARAFAAPFSSSEHSWPALICGSLAFDTIATFPRPLRAADPAGPAAHPERLVPGADPAPRVRRLRRQHRLQPAPARRRPLRHGRGRRRRRGLSSRGCAILGRDHRARPHRRRQLHRPGHHHHRHRQQPDHRLPSGRDAVGARDASAADAGSGWRSSRPTAATRCSQHAAQLAAANIPFIFDPGQGLPMFDGAELSRFVDQATWSRVNDYEAQMLCERTGQTLESLSSSHLRGIVVTLGAEGCDIWEQGVRTRMCRASRRARCVDPTGCGDAFRAALLYGLERGWSLRRCVRARQPDRRPEDRQPRRPEPCAGSHGPRAPDATLTSQVPL